MERTALPDTLQRLLALPFDDGDEMSARGYRQECLDFLAMAAGLKPVFVTGRGFSDEAWIAGAIDLAHELGLHVLTGPMWNARPARDGLPPWFVEFGNAGRAGMAVFICLEPETAAVLEKAFETGSMSETDEARLLGYPECCVRAEYDRDECLDRAYYMILARTAKGDEHAMRRLIDDDVELSAGTADEEALLDTAEDIKRAPFTSVNMCAACAAGDDSPARLLSRRYEDLARSTSSAFADDMAAAYRGPQD